MRVKPKPGMIVRQPLPPHAPLPAKGAKVPENSYWLRRLKDGDVERIDEKPAPPPRRRSASAREDDDK